MNNETTIQVIESLVRRVLEPEPLYFLVELKIRPGNQIQIFVDGDEGVTIDKCVQFNRAIYKGLEGSGLFPGDDFSLEVSSPGLDEPLKLMRQFKKNIGRNVVLILQDGTKKTGRLIQWSEDGIVLEEIKPKNGHGPKAGPPASPVNHAFLFNNIKTTKIQSVF
jgi:ribosome maturation factor RimP